MDEIDNIYKNINSNNMKIEEIKTMINFESNNVKKMLTLFKITAIAAFVLGLPNILYKCFNQTLSYLYLLTFGGSAITIFTNMIKSALTIDKLLLKQNNIQKENDDLRTKLKIISDKTYTKLYDEYLESQKYYGNEIKGDYSEDSIVELDEVIDNTPFELFKIDEKESFDSSKVLKKKFKK